MNSFYKTTNQSYGDPWKVTDSKKPDVNEVPTYKEIGDKMLEVRKAKKILKNQLVARKYGKKEEEDLDEFSAVKKKIDQNAVTFKKFPVKEIYEIPENGLKVGSPLYMTNYMDIGRLKPTVHEINSRFHPLDNKFSQQFTGGNFKNTSLNTATTISKVHDTHDHIFS